MDGEIGRESRDERPAGLPGRAKLLLKSLFELAPAERDALLIVLVLLLLGLAAKCWHVRHRALRQAEMPVETAVAKEDSDER